MTRRVAVALVLVVVVAAACGGSSSSSFTSPAIADVSDIHVFAASVEPGSGGVAQVVADLHNAADAKDALVSVSCSCGSTATLYEDGATKPASSIALPSQKVVLFGPKGARIQLTDSAQPLSTLTTVTLTFSFANAQPTTATAAIQAPGSPSPTT
jgi:copper(I)-binding protein